MSITDLILEKVNASPNMSEEGKVRFAKDVEEYDRKYYDAIASLTMILVEPKYGYSNMRHAGEYRTDPWSACHFATGNAGKLCFAVLPAPEGPNVLVDEVSLESAGAAIKGFAKAAGYPDIPRFNNNVTGFMISFSELRGSIPEHMREVMERLVWNEATMQHEAPLIKELHRWYEREVDSILGYLRSDMRRVKVSDRDNPEAEGVWHEVPITALSFGFNRFEACPDGSRQTTAFFSVSDRSPDFKPEVSYNWFCQDTSRWIYSGAIAINYSKNEETGEETVSISSHH